ncbi:MAG: alpha-L-rhamnosidase, partial [Planctomycetota bacterium]
MRRTIIAFAMILCLASTHSGSAATFAASIVPADLQCEYRDEPLGIDVGQPRLSWKLTAADPRQRGQRQTAYRILVASSKELLARDKGDLWDSGQVKSDQSNLVVYDGSALSSGMCCYWKVQVRDEQGALSAWSAPARWTMGLLDVSDWKAEWIGTDTQFVEVKSLPPEDNCLADPWLRKVVTLKDKPR